MFDITHRYNNFKYWGVHFWIMMRITSYNYPMRPTALQKNITKRFYINLQYMFPDNLYRDSYSKILKKYPIESKICCRSCLVKWVNLVYLEMIKHNNNYKVTININNVKRQLTNPKFWGPHYWFVMRAIAFHYQMSPTDFQKNITQNFYTKLQYMLPCERCRHNFIKLFKQYKIDNSMCCQKCLMQWVNLIHDNVSKHV